MKEIFARLYSNPTWLDLASVGCLLHPSFKGDVLCDSNHISPILAAAKLKAIRRLKEEVSALTPPVPPARSAQPAPEELTLQQLETIYGSRAYEYLRKYQAARPIVEVADELETFLHTPPAPLMQANSFLREWNKLKLEYPRLHQLVRKYACVQVSACAIERVWSAAGRILTDQRLSLSDEKFNKLLEIKINSTTNIVNPVRSPKRKRSDLVQ